MNVRWHECAEPRYMYILGSDLMWKKNKTGSQRASQFEMVKIADWVLKSLKLECKVLLAEKNKGENIQHMLWIASSFRDVHMLLYSATRQWNIVSQSAPRYSPPVLILFTFRHYYRNKRERGWSPQMLCLGINTSWDWYIGILLRLRVSD